MDKCPPEIHARIFSYACTDDGTTGLSLSLVSRYIYDVSSPFQWQAVSLPGYTHLVLFAQRLQRHTRTNNPKRPIYHLFISDRGTPPPVTNCWDTQPLEPVSKEATDALNFILPYASPTLLTFTFYSSVAFMGGAASMTQVLNYSYPNLTELTLRGRCTPVQLRLFNNPDLESTLSSFSMPKLRHLHLAIPCHGFSYGNLQETRNLIHKIASSNLTHLRISFLDMWGSKRIAEVLHAELAALGLTKPVLKLPSIREAHSDSPRIPITVVPSAEKRASEVTWERLFPESLQLLAVQPSPTANFYCSCCMDFRGDIDVMRLFNAMAQEADDKRFLYLGQGCQSMSMGLQYGEKEALYDWLQRIEGGIGCWGKKDFAFDEEDDRKPLRPSSKPTASSSTFSPTLTSSEQKITAPKSVRTVVRKLKLWLTALTDD
ncbi:hypothetical protein C8Q75DRAFT_764900 [Abortiporus biennis]|nr:hypothetical protein C8Q75DRAFT_764900 [Abortiporus biennis]